MKVLIAGATGVVGRPLVPMLAKSGHEVYALVRSQRPVPGGRENCAWRIPATEIKNREAVDMSTRNRVTYRQLHIAQ